MNKDTVREILSAYRPNGADADDPAFADALRHCRHDPETARWFEEERAFDREVARALRSGEPPTEGQETVLEQTATAPFRAPSRRRLLPWLGGLAAALLLGLGLFTALSNDPGGTRFQQAGFSLAGLVEQTLPLQHEAPQFSALASWLAARNAPVPAEPAGRLAHEPTVGCKIFTDEEGGRVSLVCFRVEGKLVHLFTFDDRTAGLLAGQPRGEWQENDGLHTQVFEQNGRTYALATEADPASLESGLTGTRAVSLR
jgi:hypothetical protein